MKANLLARYSIEQLVAELKRRGVNAYAVAFASSGGKAGKGAAKARSSELARKAALARWNKDKSKLP
jgi:hypothetical protein